MHKIGVIPARMASSRLPGKPLAKIHGVPMIGHVYHRSRMSKSLDALYVATCDREIEEYCASIDAPCVLTSASHERATDRTAEAMHKIESMTGRKVDMVVMIQGDEPMIVPEMIDLAVNPALEDSSIQVVNLMARMENQDEFDDPNEVKVVVDLEGNALYFSREAIPSRKKGIKDVPMLKQVCIIPFRREFLLKFNDMPQTPLEIIESVDMMRILENGGKVKMVLSEYKTWSVDTQSDLVNVESRMDGDELMKRYAGFL
jgi:3-deoxy-manno-octulosonate cytidylyltransferase (CMP-KDO synthetase)